MPQKVGYDVDLNTLPLVAFTEKVVKKAGMGQKMWLKMQVSVRCSVCVSAGVFGCV